MALVEKEPFLPTDLLVEIFSHRKEMYSLFRGINKVTRKAIIPWDGWDSLIAQGFSVSISSESISWYKNRVLNSTNWLPAQERLGESRAWYKNGKMHRRGGLPALERENGSKQWLINGNYHRDGGLPAIIEFSGTCHWYRCGKPHRDGDLPAVEWDDGFKEWYVNGKFVKSLQSIPSEK